MSGYITCTKKRRMGASVIALVLVISFFVILPLALFGFEVSRFFLMQQQLMGVTDAATLAGTAALTGLQQSQNLTALQNAAMAVVAATFEQNSVLQTNFNSSNVQISANQAALAAPTQAGHAVVNITLLDANGAQQTTGSANVVSMKVQAIFTDNTIFAQAGGFLSISPTVTVSSISSAGLPQVDMVLCFDVSASMDDATNVVLINRVWNGAKVVYNVVAGPDTIADIVGAPESGTGFDVMPPQQLSNAYYAAAGSTVGNDNQYNWCQDLRANMSISVGTPVPESGAPPGNYDPGNPTNNSNGIITAQEGGATTFTDMVVAFPNYPFTFTDSAGKTWTFSNYADEVEASRGNLESANAFQSSQAGASSNPAVIASPATGWYKAYWQAASMSAQPIAAARTAVNNFFFALNSSTNGHFALITFCDVIGSTTSGISSYYKQGVVTPYDNIDQAYSPASPYATTNYVNGGTAQFPLPLIALNQSNSNYASIFDVTSSFPTLTPGGLPLGPTGGTNISAALSEAITELTSTGQFRQGAQRVIVLFTDGIPTQPGNFANGKALSLAAAALANQNSIPIYTIGLAQAQTGDVNTTAANLISDEGSVLGDNQNGSGQGIAYTSGNGAFYLSVSQYSQLDTAFQTIARSLVSLK
jgi:von Willebrand factor type A domain